MEEKTSVMVTITTAQRAILRAISEDLYGEHNYAPLLEKVCDYSVQAFMREFKDSKKLKELKNHKENLEELRQTIIIDGLPKLQNEITGIDLPTSSFFDGLFERT